MNRLRMLAASVAAGAVLALALIPAAAASAHDYLVGSDPAAGSTVTAAPKTVTLTFNDRVLDLSGDGSSALVTVTGPDAGTRHFETGCATITDRAVSAPVALGTAGKYTINYQIVSADGHTVSDTLAFTYKPGAGAVAAPGSTGAVCGAKAGATAGAGSSAPGAQTPPGASTAAPLASPSDDSGNLGLVIGIAVGIVVLAIAGVVVIVLTGRRKK